ncbi:MAG: ImmA/IrrE family metallo-endopeptidase [Methylophilaceae bacterium]
MESTLQLSVKTLEWAASKNGSSLPEFARTLYSRENTAASITRGELTFAQIKKFAEQAKVPFGFLFLPTPPEKFTPASNLVDFRTVKKNEPLSDDFLEIYKDVEHKQSWFKDYLISIDAPKLDFVGRYKNRFITSSTVIANDIRQTLKLNEIARHIGNAEDYYNQLVKHCEDAGILVFKNSIVVNNTHKPLSSDEFRGFVIADEYAPAIFINGQDTKYANIFTLAHELAHVWLGESGISDVDTNSNNQHEVKCNAIAAEVLVPNNTFLDWWNANTQATRAKIATLNNTFKVSELVIARIALTNNKISKDEYSTIQADVISKWRENKAKQRESSGGPSFVVTLPIKNSRKVTSTVLSLLKGDQLSPSEASILLNVNAAKVMNL